jgi:polyhydroxybutyrate depolymerase
MAMNRRANAVLGALLLAALACARPGVAVPSAQNGLPAGESTRTLTHDGLKRSYILYAPASLNRSQPAAVVFVLHGGAGNAGTAIRMSGFNAAADKNGFLVVYPNGTGRLGAEILLTWNGGGCCGYAQEKNIDDVGFLRAVVADLQSFAAVDLNRIFATGMSNGGILSQRLGCEAADLFAAIAPVSGTLNFPPCNPSRPVPVIEFHGTADEHVPYNGGNGPQSLTNVDFASVKDSIGFWTSFDGCNPQPQSNTADVVRHDTWTGCRGGASVELYTIIGGGHSWPGGAAAESDLDPSTGNISATQLIWKFFAAHPKQ